MADQYGGQSPYLKTLDGFLVCLTLLAVPVGHTASPVHCTYTVHCTYMYTVDVKANLYSTVPNNTYSVYMYMHVYIHT